MRKCKVIIKETGLPCGEPATDPIYQPAYRRFSWDTKEWRWVPAKLMGYECREHAAEFDLLRQAAEAVTLANAAGRN